MSVEYWPITGYGVEADALMPYLNVKKCVSFLRKQLNDDSIEELGFDIGDYLGGTVYDDFAEMLTYLDDTDCLTYCDTGYDGRNYLYYPATYPWHFSNKDPRSEYEVRERIYRAVSQICDIDKRTLDDMAGYIGEVGAS